ncbi:LamG-like jellyroll fold domain-containing protein [Catenulispora yoronensis]|uniref:LamG-like jellyroll fold domain-containing protein n=1 Tax=Catenulispora yoronensis TaxID=450799 RepID=UPI0031E3546E
MDAPSGAKRSAAKSNQKQADGRSRFDAAKSTEVVAQRTETSTTFRNPDGSFTLRQYSQPVHVRQADGSWADVDTTLKRDAKGQLAPSTVAMRAEVAGSSDSPAFESFTIDDAHRVDFALSGAATVPAAVDGSSATFAGVFPQTDITVTAGASSLKETLVLRSRGAGNSWTFPIHAVGLTPTIDADGSVAFTDASGTIRALVPPGTMQDSAKTPTAKSYSTAVTYSLVTLDGGTALRVTADRAWLDDPARVFPVSVDPTINAPVNATSATYVDNFSNKNHSSNSTMMVGNDGTGKTYNSFLAFSNLASSLQNAWVTSAALHLYQTSAVSATPVVASPITSSWNVATLAAWPGPSLGGPIGNYGATGQGWISLALTPDFLNGCTHGQSVSSCGIGLTAETADTQGFKIFASVTGSQNLPWLDINYTPYSATYVDATPVVIDPPITNVQSGAVTVTVTNHGSATWSPTSGDRLGYHVYDHNGADLGIAGATTQIPATVPPNGSVAVTGIIGALAPADYTVCWDMIDPAGNWYSADSATNPAGCLAVTVNDVAPVVDRLYPGYGYVFSTLTPTLTASAHDPDQWPDTNLQYRFTLYSPQWPYGYTSPLSANSVWTVPAGVLGWGDSFTWYVKATQSNGVTSGQSETVRNSVRIPQPTILSHLGGGGADTYGADSYTGNYTTSATDAVVPTVGPSLQVQRTYNSLDSRTDALFGEGWSSVFDANVKTLSSGSVQVRYPNGQGVVFGLNPNGSFSTPPGRQATLTKASDGSGTFTLVDKDGSRFSFGADGKLSAVADVQGRAITLAYDEGGTFSTVTSSVSHRALHFTWVQSSRGNSHVSSVSTDPLVSGTPSSALTWTYSYNQDDLVKVCPPTSTTACTGYGYTAGSHLRSELLDANPDSYLRLADAVTPTNTVLSDEVSQNTLSLSQARAINVATTSDVLSGNDSDTGLAFNGTSSYVTAPNALGGGSSLATVELWFKTTTPGGVLFADQGGGVTSTFGSGDTVNPALYIGQDGHVHGAFTEAGSSQIQMDSHTVVTDGKWHHIALVAETGDQALYLDGLQCDSAVPAVTAPTAYTRVVGAGWIRPTYASAPATAQAWYFRGEISNFAYFSRSLTYPDIINHYDTNSPRFPAAKQLTSITLPSGKSYATIGYATGQDRVGTLTDQNGGTWKPGKPSVSRPKISYADQVLGSHPIDYFRLNEASGTVAHSAVYQDTVARNAAVSNVQWGAYGSIYLSGDSAASFNGSNSYVQLPTGEIPGQGRITVEIGFQTSSAGTLIAMQDRGLTDVQSPANATPLLYVGADGKVHANVPGSGSHPLIGKVSNDNRWHDVIFSYDTTGGFATLYEDGAKVEDTLEYATVPVVQNYVYVGAGYVAPSLPSAPSNARGYFNGLIGQVSIYGAGGDHIDPYLRWSAVSLADQTTLETTVAVTDPANNKVTYTYDPGNGGRITSRTDQLGGFSAYQYDDRGYLNVISDPDGHSTSYSFDENGNPVSTTTCASPSSCQTSTAAYVGDVNSLAITDPRFGLRDSQTDAAGAKTSYTYDAAGDLLTTAAPSSSAFPNGRTTRSTYTVAGSTSSCASGTAPGGLLASTTTPGGAKTSYTYYANGDLCQVTDATGLVTSYTYDVLGRSTVRTVTWPTGPAGGLTTRTTYDGQNRIWLVADPTTTDQVSGLTHIGNHWTSYDVDGNITGEQIYDSGGGDAGGDAPRMSTATYDAHNHVATVTDAVSNVTKYTAYDLFGNVTSMTDSGGNVFTAAYGPTGQHWSTTLTGYTGDPVSQTAPRDVVIASYAYDPAGRLATSTDAMGRTHHYRYFDDGRVVQETFDGFHNADGTTRTVDMADFTYDSAGRVLSAVKGGGKNSMQYTYDDSGRLVSTLDGTGLVTEFTDDADGNHTRIARHDQSVLNPTTANSSITDATYDPLGRTVSQTLHGGLLGNIVEATTWTLDARGLPLTSVSPRGNDAGATASAYTTDYVYDEAGRLVKTVAPPVSAETGGNPATTVRPTTVEGFDTYGDLVEHRDPDGRTSVTGYDQLGRQITRQDAGYIPPGAGAALNAQTVTAYTALGQVKTVTDGLNNVTSYRYDQLGRLATTTDPLVAGAAAAGVWHYTYDLDGEQLSAIDPTGAQVQATYDDLGRIATSTSVERSPAGAFTTQYGYDDAGNPVSITDPLQNKTTAVYDAGNRLTSRTDPALNTTKTAYNYLSLPLSVTAPDGTAKTASYGPDGQQYATSLLDSHGTVLSTTRVAYDSAGNQIGQTDPNGAVWTRSFDALNRITQQVEPVTDTTSIIKTFGYDAAGNQTRFTDGRGANFITTYNGWGLPESGIEPATSAFPNAADRTWTTTYDANRRPTILAEPGGVKRTESYDALGRLTGETGTGAEAATAAHTYKYDLAGRLLSVAAPGGDDTFGYDDRGDLTSTAGPSGTSSFQYDGDGQMLSRTDASGTATYQYDADGRLKTLNEPLTGTQAALGYDTVGELTSVNYGTGGATRKLDYDGLHRITADTLKNPAGAVEASIGYGYDTIGHLTSKTTTGTAGAAANTYTYDYNGRLTSWNNGATVTGYGYDASGNRTSAGGVTATFDARDRLLNAGSTSYTYTARGTRSSQTVGGTTSASTYDAFDRLITDGSTTNVYDGLDRLVTSGATHLAYSGTGNTIASDGTSLYSRDPSGGVVGVKTGAAGTAAFALTDRHTDLVATFTATGSTLTGSTAYDPFGKKLASSGTQPSVGFQSEWTDPDSGKVNMAARWFDPATGAFTSRDTAGDSDANRYAYGSQDPLDTTDPSGHCWVCIGALIGAVAGAVIGGISYTISWATDDNVKWSWSEFGKKVAKGAVTGAIFGATAAMGPFGQALGGALSEEAAFAMDCAAGHKCTLEGAVKAALAGGAAGLAAYGLGRAGGAVWRLLRESLEVDAEITAEQVVDAVAQDAEHQLEVDAATKAAEQAAAKAAAKHATEKAAAEAAARDAEVVAAKKAAEAAAAEAKRKAEEAAAKKAAEEAHQRWLASPAGRATQAASNEGPDVAAAQARHAADSTVPASSLPTETTPSLAENLSSAGYTVADNAAPVVSSGAEESAAGVAVHDTAADPSSGGLGGPSDVPQAGGSWAGSGGRSGFNQAMEGARNWASNQALLRRMMGMPMEVWSANRALAKSLNGAAPEANATVETLKTMRHGNSAMASKAEGATALSDEDLLASVFHPKDKQFIATNPDVTDELGQGNHRMAQLLARAIAGKSDIITWDTEIFIHYVKREG